MGSGSALRNSDCFSLYRYGLAGWFVAIPLQSKEVHTRQVQLHQMCDVLAST